VDLTRPLRPVPAPSPRPWAGSRLGEGVGEIWLAGPASLVEAGAGSPLTLDGLAGLEGEALVGSAGMAMLGPRFPLLAKLIDAADWLSLQVHPDDSLARRLRGAEAVGKDEAWLVLEAAGDTRLVVGPAGTLDAAAVMALVAAGTMGLEDCAVHAALPGDVLSVPAGTIHAIGPGAFVYELEQPSDLTFRISDWGRPPVPGRHLHLAEARQAVDPSLHAVLAGSGWQLAGGSLNGRRIRLELVPSSGPVVRRPGGRSPELVTAIGGSVVLVGEAFEDRLAPLETAVLPAALSACEVLPGDGAMAVVGSLPG
jgi:mannose-6-phosphate isomerase